MSYALAILSIGVPCRFNSMIALDGVLPSSWDLAWALIVYLSTTWTLLPSVRAPRVALTRVRVATGYNPLLWLVATDFSQRFPTSHAIRHTGNVTRRQMQNMKSSGKCHADHYVSAYTCGSNCCACPGTREYIGNRQYTDDGLPEARARFRRASGCSCSTGWYQR